MEKIFKAKRLDNGEWLEFDFTDIAGTYASGKVEILTEDCTKTISVALDTISQYTGINDSEGNKVFESDEVIILDGYNTLTTVYFDKEDLQYCTMTGSHYCCDLVDHEVKLTGRNIHDRG